MKKAFTIILGDRNFSSWSLRSWLLLKHLGIKFEEKTIKLYTPETQAEILKYSPSGKVPVLIHNGYTVWDTLAIAEYLNEEYPDAKLWPDERFARGYARSICNEVHSGFGAMRRLMPFSVKDIKRTPVFTDLHQEIERIEEIWLECLTNYSKSGDYLFDKFTIADAMFAPVVLRFKTYSYISKNPAIQDYCSMILENPYIREWVAET